ALFGRNVAKILAPLRAAASAICNVSAISDFSSESKRISITAGSSRRASLRAAAISADFFPASVTQISENDSTSSDYMLRGRQPVADRIDDCFQGQASSLFSDEGIAITKLSEATSDTTTPAADAAIIAVW